MQITTDENGYPLLLATQRVATKSGNPYHSSLTGEFTNAPAGVLVLKGENLLKLLSPGTKKILADRAKIGKANQLAAEIIDGKLHIVLLRDGKRVHSFSVKPKTQGSNERVKVTPVIKDALIENARNLGLSDEQIIKNLQEISGVEFSDEQREEILELIKEQRLEDTIAYLHYQLQVRTKERPQDDAILRIAVGRGYFRRVFSQYDEAQTKIILDRLRAKGWGDEILQAAVITKFPKRLKEVFTIEHKQDKGKDELTRTRQAARKEAGKEAKPKKS
jgi:hypothetical protein